MTEPRQTPDPREDAAVAALLVRALHEGEEPPVEMRGVVAAAADRGRRIRRRRGLAAGAAVAIAVVAIGSAATSGLFVRDSGMPATRLVSPDDVPSGSASGSRLPGPLSSSRSPGSASGSAPSALARGTAAATAAATRAAAVSARKTCGVGLPQKLFPPKGYTGPIDGPLDAADPTPVPQQLVVHWAGAGGSIEVRWPAAYGTTFETTDGWSASISSDAEPTVVAEVPVSGAKGDCRWFRVTLRWPPPEDYGYVIGVTAPGSAPSDRASQAFQAFITDPAAFVTGTRRVSTLPARSVACSGSGKRVSGAPDRDTLAGDAEASMRRFLTPTKDYSPPVTLGSVVKLVDPQGRVVYAAPMERSSQWVGLIRMLHRPDGWVVAGYEASAC